MIEKNIGIADIKEKQSLTRQDDIYKTSDSKRPPWIASLDNNKTSNEIKITPGKGMESVDKKELQEAVQMVKESILYIKENATTEVEKETAQTLETMAKEGRVFIGDTSQDVGHPVYGFFHPEYDLKKGKDKSYIVIDYNALAYGKAEAIDTLAHEAYHAAQYKEGHKNDLVEEETRAWNIGLDMSNRYRKEAGEYIAQAKPYTQSDIENFGYTRNLGYGIFTELTGNSTGVMA